MEPSIYSFSLCSALPLMLFFDFYFLFAKTPEKKIFKNYLRSQLAESSGFLSHSNFIKLFSEKEGCTPAKWKKSNRE